MHLLYDLGHERIGIITGPLASPLSRDRMRARRRGEKRSGEECRTDGDLSVRVGTEAGTAPLTPAPRRRRRFRFNDENAMGVLEFARRNRLRGPALSVVGFDEIRSRVHHPPR